MVDLPYTAALENTVEAPRARSSVLDFCRREPLGTFGLVLVAVMAVAGLGAELIAPYSPTANDFAAMTEPPSWAHLMGTDQFGRDLFSRIIFGARTALIVGFSWRSSAGSPASCSAWRAPISAAVSISFCSASLT